MRKVHYSQPGGFVGRSICYLIYHQDTLYGAIVAGSSTKHLPGRHDALGTDHLCLNNIINNTFYHIDRPASGYPLRNFATRVIQQWRSLAQARWQEKYGDPVVGFETLVEPPRTGECYLRDGWTLVGKTKGFTCKRTGGKGTDSWGGRRVWNEDSDQLRPKLVLVRPIDLFYNQGPWTRTRSSNG